MCVVLAIFVGRRPPVTFSMFALFSMFIFTLFFVFMFTFFVGCLCYDVFMCGFLLDEITTFRCFFVFLLGGGRAAVILCLTNITC